MDNAWPVKYEHSFTCCAGFMICVASKHGLVIVPKMEIAGGFELHVHSLADGSFVRKVGGKGRGRGKFNFGYGGLCMSPDGDSLLVADCYNHRVQQIRILDWSWERFVGIGVLERPEHVDCNTDTVVVAEEPGGGVRISVLSWADGSLQAQFGTLDDCWAQLEYPGNLRLLADGSGVVIIDCYNHRLCVFSLSGEALPPIGERCEEVHTPFDVLECDSDGGFIAANFGCDSLVKFGRDGAKLGCFHGRDWGGGEFRVPSALAKLPGGGLLVRDSNGARIQVFHGLDLRKSWITACATLATRGRGGVVTKRARVGGV
jgi:hypothetical protein